MNLEYCGPSSTVGKIDVDAAVETPWSQQSRIENVRAVGRRDDNDRCPLVEAIHFDQDLVQCLVVFGRVLGASALTSD